MKKTGLCFIAASMLYSSAVMAQASAQKTSLVSRTIVLLRHGEKPEAKIGQLNCQGLNRSFKLPAVLFGKFGKPDYLFAPNPNDTDGSPYIRALSTLVPTAVQFGEPMNIQFGKTDIAPLVGELLQKTYDNTTVFAAWEHKNIVGIAKYMCSLAAVDCSSQVPDWDDADYDSLYILKVVSDGSTLNGISVSFSKDKEGLSNIVSAQCPN